MKRRMVRVLSIGLVTSLALPSLAFGQGPQSSAATADSLFRSAKEAAALGDLMTACAQFAESQRLDPAIGTLLNLADCESRSGKLAIALVHVKAARDGMPSNDFRLAFAANQIADLEARVPRITLVVAPPDAPVRVMLDETAVAPASLGVQVPVDPGRHTITVSMPGHAVWREDVILSERERRTVTVIPGAPLGDEKPASRSGSHGVSRTTIGYLVGGLGIAGLGVGVVTGVMTMSAASTYKDHCNASGACDPQGLDAASTGRVTSVVSPAAFAAGLAGVGVGAYLLLVRPKSSGAGVAVVPHAMPEGAGLSAVGAF